MSGGFIVLDIETDGYGTFRPPVHRPVEVAWVVCDAKGVVLKRCSRFVSGVEQINPKAQEIHGYSADYINAHGVPLEEVLRELDTDARGAQRLIGHNIAFDIGCLCNQDRLLNLRGVNQYSLIPFLRALPLFCTMLHGTDMCRLPSRHWSGGFKWPKLCELAEHAGVVLDPERLHGAMYDVEVTLDCYRKLFL